MTEKRPSHSPQRRAGSRRASSQAEHGARARKTARATKAARTAHVASAGKPSRRPDEKGLNVTLPGGEEVLLTRRHFLYGALGLGALAAVGAGAGALSQMKGSDSEIGNVLEVPEAAVTSSDNCTLIEDASQAMALVGDFELPYGTLVWANTSTVAACLIPCETAKPLTQVGVLMLGSGACPIVLEQAVGLDEGYEVYDARASERGLVWTEADILGGTWRVWAATCEGGVLGQPFMLEEGGGDWETPTLAAVGDYAFWQVMPKAEGAARAEDSRIMRARFGTADGEAVYTSTGRPSSPPYATADGVVVTPRVAPSSPYHQLTYLDAATGKVRDTLVLPASMKAVEAGYGETGFMFAFDGIYSYGDGIANLGTYAPKAAVDPVPLLTAGEVEAAKEEGAELAGAVVPGNAAYSDASWFRFARTPSSAPAWCGRWLMVKSSTAVCGVSCQDDAYFALDVRVGSDTYGDYLASTGTNDVVVTFANIDHTSLTGERERLCNVRVWAPIG